MSLNRWVFKWCLNVETLSNSLMSAGKEFQMDGGCNRKSTPSEFGLYLGNDQQRIRFKHLLTINEQSTTVVIHYFFCKKNIIL